jgi:hypothetical protein
MAEEWELKELGRRIDSLQRDLERDRERAEAEKNRNRELRVRFLGIALWTFYVVAMTAYVVLAATGNLHHH